MAGYGRVRLSAIFEMLSECAPGYTVKEGQHRLRITWKDKVHPSLPKGEHGKGDRAEIEKGEVRKLIRILGIEDCATRVLEILR